jgi:hypothetical protein
MHNNVFFVSEEYMRSKKQEEQLEHLKNVSIAAVSALPVLGGPLSVLMDKYIPSYIERRRSKLIEKISKDLQRLSKRITPEHLASDEFSSVFIKAFRRAMEEHLEEKLEAFRYIILNAAISNSSEFDEQTLFLRLVSDLTVDQIRILKLLQRKDKIHKDTEGLFKVMKKTWPDADPDYLMACVTELLRSNLVSSNPKDRQKQGQHFLTGLGKRFVAYISRPK